MTKIHQKYHRRRTTAEKRIRNDRHGFKNLFQRISLQIQSLKLSETPIKRLSLLDNNLMLHHDNAISCYQHHQRNNEISHLLILYAFVSIYT